MCKFELLIGFFSNNVLSAGCLNYTIHYFGNKFNKFNRYKIVN